MNLSSDWFIAPRVRRLQSLIHLLPQRAPGVPGSELVKTLRPQTDSPPEDIPLLVHVLARLDLLHVDTDRYYLSRKGRRAATLSEDRALKELAQLIIQSGLMHDQVRQVIEASIIDSEGMARSRVRQLRHAAPQLLGLLRAWPGIVGPSFVKIPPSLFALIDAPWSLVPAPSEREGAREAVGHRAEAYSFHLLRLEAECPTSVVWVSRDDQGLGYDIEDRSSGGIHRVEVKGSQSNDVRFVLTANEHQVSHQDPGSYEVHYWGEINLHRNPDVEFNTLRQQGFPLRFEDLAAHLADHRLQASPIRYLVTRGADI